MYKSKNTNITLNKAKDVKKDEFHTQLSDIECELKHYKDHFKGKVVYCNCDDPRYSNFPKYFLDNFAELELERLIATCKNDECSFYLDSYSSDTEKYKIEKLLDNGDFRSQECIRFLKQSDIVVTNPPFSLFREHFDQIMEYNKKFLVIGHQNAIIYKNIFPYIRDNQVWLGYGFKGDATHFINRAGYDDYAVSTSRKDGMIRVSGVVWFTNLEIDKNRELILHKKYNPEEYQKYENYNAIEVSKTSNIPMDYDGIMGVPVSFMNKYNPNQFKIIGSNRGVDQDPNGVYGRGSYIDGKEVFKRIFICLKK